MPPQYSAGLVASSRVVKSADLLPAWLQRPGLAWQQAFDRCAVEVTQCAQPVTVLASSLFYAREVVRRFAADIVIYPTRDWGMAPTDILQALGPEICWDRVHLCSAQELETRAAAGSIVWATPEEANWRGIVSLMGRLVSPGTKLCVLGSSDRFRRLLPELSTAGRSLQATDSLVRGLKAAGYTVESRYGFQGPFSILLGAASRLPSLMGRDDLVDRSFATMRQRLIVRNGLAVWSPIWMIVGRYR